MERIGTLHSIYADKFGVPRQSGLAPDVECELKLDPARVPAEALRGLEQCSHLWVIFEFHLAGPARGATVRPPRLGGNERLGVLATRSPFRPNPIGLSAVRLLGVEGHTLRLAGGDFVDGTPVLDIKPYLPYADSLPDAECGWAPGPPAPLEVRMTARAAEQLEAHPEAQRLEQAIVQALRWDPRPAYQREKERSYAVRLLDVDVRWEVLDGVLSVLSITHD